MRSTTISDRSRSVPRCRRCGPARRASAPAVGIVARPGLEGGRHPRRGLRVLGIDPDQPIGQEPVARARGIVKAGRVSPPSARPDRAQAVGVWSSRTADGRSAAGPSLPASAGAAWTTCAMNHLSITSRSYFQRSWKRAAMSLSPRSSRVVNPRDLVGHVGGRLRTAPGRGPVPRSAPAARARRCATTASRPAPHPGCSWGRGPSHRRAPPASAQGRGPGNLQGSARGVDRRRVGDEAGIMGGLRQIILGRQRQRQRAESGRAFRPAADGSSAANRSGSGSARSLSIAISVSRIRLRPTSQRLNGSGAWASSTSLSATSQARHPGITGAENPRNSDGSPGRAPAAGARGHGGRSKSSVVSRPSRTTRVSGNSSVPSGARRPGTRDHHRFLQRLVGGSGTSCRR